jgi:hypothetical protein
MPETTAKPSKRPETLEIEPVEASLPAVTQNAPVAPKKKLGRPSKYSPELAAEIAQRLSTGEPLRKICRDEHMPHWTVMYDWLAKDKDLYLQVARAREAGYEALAEEALEIADERPEVNELIDKKTGEVLNIDLSSAYISWQKNRIETRLKLLACWSPAKYGNRTVVAGDDKNPLVVEASFDVFGEVLKHLSMAKLDGQPS